MKDRRSVDDLSIEELEEVLRIRKREARLERLRQQGKTAEGGALDPLTPKAPPPQPPPLPTEHRRYQDSGATAQYRATPVDEPDEAGEERQRTPYRIQWRWVFGKLLLLIELGVVAALILALFTLWTTIGELNQEASQEQASLLPTLAPTPLIRVAILPGGHTPPDPSGQAEPEEIPAHLRDLVGEITPLPLPTVGPEQATRILIPAIGVDSRVVEGDDWESLKLGAGHHVGSANPGENGNCVISAHNDIFGEVFRDLPDLDVGEEVLVHTESQLYRYVVTQSRIIEPAEVSVMYPTSSPVLTLISCYPYGIDTHRIVVIAELQP